MYLPKNYVPSSGLTPIFCRGGVYPRPQTSENNAAGGDKPRPYYRKNAFYPPEAGKHPMAELIIAARCRSHPLYWRLVDEDDNVIEK